MSRGARIEQFSSCPGRYSDTLHGSTLSIIIPFDCSSIYKWLIDPLSVLYAAVYRMNRKFKRFADAQKSTKIEG